MRIVPKKCFAGVLSPVNSPEAGKLHEVFLPTHYPNAECAQTHFHWSDVNIVGHPSYRAMLPK